MNLTKVYTLSIKLSSLKVGDIIKVLGYTDNVSNGALMYLEPIGSELVIDMKDDNSICRYHKPGHYNCDKCPVNRIDIIYAALNSKNTEYTSVCCYYILGDKYGRPLI